MESSIWFKFEVWILAWFDCLWTLFLSLLKMLLKDILRKYLDYLELDFTASFISWKVNITKLNWESGFHQSPLKIQPKNLWSRLSQTLHFFYTSLIHDLVLIYLLAKMIFYSVFAEKVYGLYFVIGWRAVWCWDHSDIKHLVNHNNNLITPAEMGEGEQTQFIPPNILLSNFKYPSKCAFKKSSLSFLLYF